MDLIKTSLMMLNKRRIRLLCAVVGAFLLVHLFVGGWQDAPTKILAGSKTLYGYYDQGDTSYWTETALNRSFYAELLKQYPLFPSYKRLKRCDIYFQQLFSKHPDFKPWPMANSSDVVETSNVLTHIRVYNRCYLQQGDTRVPPRRDVKSDEDVQLEKRAYFSQNLQHLHNLVVNGRYGSITANCASLQKAIFPYISTRLPTFIRWTGERYYDIPNINAIRAARSKEDAKLDLNAIRYHEDFLYRPAESKFEPCLLNHYMDRMNGKGIVLTITDEMLDTTLSYLKVLRAENNLLPIQIVKDNLSPETIQRIVEMARKPFSKNDIPGNLYNNIPNDRKLVGDEFPKQEIWFVDVSDCISQDYKYLFEKYTHKFVAILYSSFEDTLLMDADAVPLVSPQEFFGLTQYKTTQTVFFQDRSEFRFNKPEEVDFFKEILPTSLDTQLFGIPHATDHTLQNRWFRQRFYQYMEAGIVGINRRRHFGGLLMATQLNFWFTEHRDMTYGDKDLYWLGLSLAGDEDYQFNTLSTAAAGQFTPAKYYAFPESHTLEISSTHPAHISDNDNHTLLWLNSGFLVCKKPDAVDKDLENPQYSKYSKEQLLTHYSSPVKIEAALVPPVVDKEYHNDIGEPFKAWDMDSFCANYNWRAFERVGGSNDPHLRGLVVRYNNDEINWFDYIGHVWVSR